MQNEINLKQTGLISGMHEPYFKPWMRVVAFFLVACMLYQDALAGYGPDLAATINNRIKPYTPSTAKSFDLVSLLVPSAYADDDKKTQTPPPPPPKNNSTSNSSSNSSSSYYSAAVSAASAAASVMFPTTSAVVSAGYNTYQAYNNQAGSRYSSQSASSYSSSSA